MQRSRLQEIEELFNLALEVPREDRRSFIRDRAGGDGDLAREVLALLDAFYEEGDLLSQGVFEVGLKALGEPEQVLNPGQRFDQFEVIELVGRGGMGEVYLAKDMRLGRMTALKVLPSGLGSEDEGIRRFIQEARTASALNHPNILTIYDVGEYEGRHFISSEFVEGDTLRERLKKGGPLAENEVRRVFSQISAALSAAHHAGIVHRDIKPENVMIRDDGFVKVLDFGLAKLLPDQIGARSEDEHVSTNPGVILGTVSYMSPEQVRGKDTDARSDIWSLGVVLCEMLTGSLPFEGETPSDKIAAILKSDPEFPVRDIESVPEAVRNVIAKALEKSPAARYSTVAKMSEDLELAFGNRSVSEAPDSSLTDYRQVPQTGRSRAHTSTGKVVEGISRRRLTRKEQIVTGVLVVAALGLLATVMYFVLRASESAPLVRSRIGGSGKSVEAAISPDGKYVALIVVDRGTTSLHINRLGANRQSVLLDPEKGDIGAIAFSRDSEFVYYLRGWNPRTLYKISILGGDPEKVAENVDSPVSFSPDGKSFAFIRALPDGASALVVRYGNEHEKQIAKREGGTRFGTGGVSWSADGKLIATAITEMRDRPVMDIAVYSVDGGDPRLIAPGDWRDIAQVAWLPDGSGLVAAALALKGENYSQLWFFPINGGPAEPVTDELVDHHGASITGDGKKLLTVEWQNRVNIWKIPGGKSELANPISNSIHANYRALAVAPNEKIVFPSNEDTDGNRDIWVMDPDATSAKRLTNKQGGNILPCVTSDGRYIVFASNRTDRKSYHIWRMNIDGGDARQLTFGASERGPVCPPDPSILYFHTGGPDQGLQASRIARVSVDGGEFEVLTDYPAGRSDISPDGKLLASVCRPDPKSQPKICIVPSEGGRPIRTFELEQLSYLRWRPDGRSITFTKTIDGVSNLWEQPVGGGPQKQFTNFAAERILYFDWSAKGDLFCSRGYEINDAILLTNFR